MKTSFKSPIKKLGVILLASGGLSGYVPFAPGTAGAFVGLLIVFFFRHTPVWIYSLICLMICVIAVWVADEAGRILKVADSSHIVIDEIVGIMVTMIGITVSPYTLFWGFVLFRLFDVIKFPPAHFVDRNVKNGLGVVLDDVISGIYGNIILHLMLKAKL